MAEGLTVRKAESSLASGVLVCFVAVFFMLNFGIGMEYITVDTMTMALWTLFSLCLSVILLFWCTPKGTDNKLFIVLFLPPTVAMFCYYTLYQLNIRLDTSLPQIFETEILSKFHNVPRTRGSSSYRIFVRYWRASEPEQVELNVDSLFYRNYRTIVGNHARLTTRQGWLGYEWIEKYDVVEGAATQP